MASQISQAVSQAFNLNKQAAVSAAVLTAGQVANSQLAKLAASRAPMMARGYIDTPVGRLVLANIASLAVTNFRSSDTTLKRLTDAMVVQAMQEIIGQLDIDGLIDELLSNSKVSKVIKNLEAQVEPDEAN